jgi:P27 family predicted phage terminase small subunit
LEAIPLKGRNPYPFEVIKNSNDKDRFTKEQLENREANEPTLNSAVLKCPAYLPPEAKKEWNRVVKLYRQLSRPIVTDLDVNALEVYCLAVVRYRKATAKIAETSEVFASKNDPSKPRLNPWLKVANDAAIEIKKYGEILLLDPVSRARASIAQSKKNDDDPMAEFFKRREENV